MKILLDFGFLGFGLAMIISLLLAFTKNTWAKLRVPAIIQVLAASLVLVGAIKVFVSGEVYSWTLDYLNLFTGVRFVLDRLAAFFVIIIALVVIPVSIYSSGYIEEYSKRYSLTYFSFFSAVFILAMLMVVLARNVFFFLVAWELMSVSSYFLVLFENGKRSTVDAGSLYIIMTHLGALFLIVGFALLSYFGGSFDLDVIRTNLGDLPIWALNLIFISLFIAFGSKAGLIPLHIWLPEAHPAAPSNVSALMSGVMLKVAVYGFVRFFFDLIGFSNIWWGIVVALLGALTALMGIIYAVIQKDIKRFLAFSSVENMGIIFATLGVAGILSKLGLTELSNLALAGALFHSINHAVYKSLLFLGAGNILYTTHTRKIDELGGLFHKLPRTAVWFFIGTAALAALPPLNGFMSEWTIILSIVYGIKEALQPGIQIILILTGTLIALTAGSALYGFVTLYGIIFSGTPRSNYYKNMQPIKPVMEYSLGILAVITLILAMSTNWILNQLGSSFSYGLAPFISILLFIVAGFVYFVVKLINPTEKVEVGETWACGFNNLNGKLQYTAKGFVQPFRRNYQFAIKSEQKKQFAKSAFKKEKLMVEYSIVDLFQEGIYEPTIRFTHYLSEWISKIHLGYIQVYILYIMIALVVVLIKVMSY